jgi:putative FmdB family regulatory protein
MPLYEYRCPGCGALETHFRAMGERNRRRPACPTCGRRNMELQISRPHIVPDGVYSYAPNIGDPDRFERQREAIKRTKETGVQQVIERE